MPVSNPFEAACWITVPAALEGAAANAIQTAYFRLEFEASAGARSVISISASSRYQLYVNGKPAAFGPCRGDRWRHFYETVDIGPYLVAGKNLLAVKAVAWPPYEAQHGDERGPFWTMAKALGPCLVVAGECTGGAGFNCELTTGAADWKACRDQAVGWRHFPMTQWMGAMERVRGSLLPRGWKDSVNPGGQWTQARVMGRASEPMLDMFGIIPVFPLTPRPIPMLYEREGRFHREMPLKASDLPAFTFGGLTAPAVIPPHTKRAVELDAGGHMTAFLRLGLTGGAGACVTVRYAESYARREGRHLMKGRRDDWEHYELIGHEDEYRPSGGEDVYEPFWFRTFRFLRIEVETADEPLTVGIPSFVETGYPLEAVSRVESPESWVGALWEISVRTLRRCMHETYEDCPYYEQLQYIQDTRLEMLFTYMVSGDTRMALRSIHDFHASLLPDGMLQARFPTQEPHVIPPFSLHWISMLAEYYEQTGDASVPRRYRPTADAILDWYDRKLGDKGLVEDLGYWDQIDWVEQWDTIAGRTPAGASGPATTHNLMYAVALRAGAVVNRVTGREAVAAEYEARAASICANTQKHCWNPVEQLYMEGPGYEEYSQHAQVYAVLCGLVTGAEARALLERALSRPGIALCSFTWQFFLFRALERCGAYDLTEKQWDMWKALLDKNLTTVPEIPDGEYSPRSDCHAWGALALYEFTRNILGVNPGKPGWEEILIRPRPLSLPAASGQVITPKGVVTVEWKNSLDGFALRAVAPMGVPVTVMLPDGRTREYPEGGDVAI